jgi:hypothetical protein
MPLTRRALTPQEREQRRAEERELVCASIEQLRTSDGWQGYLKARRRFPSYSWRNVLILSQHPTAERVAGFRAWLDLGYCVTKGSKGIRIWARCAPSPKRMQAWRAAGTDPDEMPRATYRLVSVFDTLSRVCHRWLAESGWAEPVRAGARLSLGSKCEFEGQRLRAQERSTRSRRPTGDGVAAIPRVPAGPPLSPCRGIPQRAATQNNPPQGPASRFGHRPPQCGAACVKNPPGRDVTIVTPLRVLTRDRSAEDTSTSGGSTNGGSELAVPGRGHDAGGLPRSRDGRAWQ